MPADLEVHVARGVKSVIVVRGQIEHSVADRLRRLGLGVAVLPEGALAQEHVRLVGGPLDLLDGGVTHLHGASRDEHPVSRGQQPRRAGICEISGAVLQCPGKEIPDAGIRFKRVASLVGVSPRQPHEGLQHRRAQRGLEMKIHHGSKPSRTGTSAECPDPEQSTSLGDPCRVADDIDAFAELEFSCEEDSNHREDSPETHFHSARPVGGVQLPPPLETSHLGHPLHVFNNSFLGPLRYVQRFGPGLVRDCSAAAPLNQPPRHGGYPSKHRDDRGDWAGL
mmetsp:Transcript_18298/g.40520  ORF Transcript_18298/g.40520 Transcript_18298/m.40520 type:complete len:280 (-) Transcript_18298:19-858(-)